MCPTLKTPGCETARRLAAAEERVKVLAAALGRLADASERCIRLKLPPAPDGATARAINAARAALQEAPRDGE